MSVGIDLVLEPGLATVRPRSDRRGIRGRAPAERFRGAGPDEVVAAAVRGARCLRTLRHVDLRVVLETAEVTFRVRPVGPDASPHVPEGGMTVASGPTGRGGAVLDVGVPAALVAAVTTGLHRRRCWGTVRMELGALARAAALLERAGPDVRARPGVVVDVTRAAVTVLEVDGDGVLGGRAAPAADVRAALVAAAPVLRERLTAGGAADGRRPWLHLAVPRPLEVGVRAVCAGALPPGRSVDLLRLRTDPR